MVSGVDQPGLKFFKGNSKENPNPFHNGHDVFNDWCTKTLNCRETDRRRYSSQYLYCKFLAMYGRKFATYF